MRMQTTLSISNNRITVCGPLTFKTVPDLVNNFRDSLSTATEEEVLVDLSEVPKADSAGLALLLEWLAIAQNEDKKLVFTGIVDQVSDFARVNGLDNKLLNSPQD